MMVPPGLGHSQAHCPSWSTPSHTNEANVVRKVRLGQHACSLSCSSLPKKTFCKIRRHSIPVLWEFEPVFHPQQLEAS